MYDYIEGVVKINVGGRYFLLDERDADKLPLSTFHVVLNNKKPYLWARPAWGKRQLVHAILLPSARGLRTDHINRDSCDNRRANLRICTNRQNLLNSKTRLNKSGYKGVHLRYGKYWAIVRPHGEDCRAGGFESPEDAARAYDALAVKHFGEYAGLNFPQPQSLIDYGRAREVFVWTLSPRMLSGKLTSMRAIDRRIKKARTQPPATQLDVLMAERHISSGKLGALIGVTGSAVRLYRKGAARPNIRVAEKISTFFNKSLSDIFGSLPLPSSDPWWKSRKISEEEALRIVTELREYRAPCARTRVAKKLGYDYAVVCAVWGGYQAKIGNSIPST